MYEIIALIAKYVLTLAIYLFIYNIAKLIYLDIKTITAGEDTKALVPHLALLSPLPGPKGQPVTELFPLLGIKTTIGRGSNCAIVLTDPHVSAEHAIIFAESGQFYIEDPRSANGTFVNGNRIRERTLLKNGDKLSMGAMTLVYSEGGR